MRNLLKNIGYAVICIIVAPAAVIHIAYRTWFRRFYYYKTTLHGQTVYLQVAELDYRRKNGRIKHSRFLYCITDELKQ